MSNTAKAASAGVVGAFALAFALSSAALAGPADPRKAVLLVFDEDKELLGLAQINRSVQEIFKGALAGDVEFYSESLNLSRFDDPGYHGLLRDHFRLKYARKHFDLIVAVMEPSLDFLLRHRAALFPGVPIVFCVIDSSDVQGRTPADVTGVLVKRSFAPTLAIALRLQPDTDEIVVVSGTSRFDQRLLAIARREFEPFQDRVRISYLTGLPIDQLLTRVSRLPSRSAIIYLTFFADGAGRAFIPHEALSRIAQVASAPVYVSLDQYVGLGALGGHVYSVANHGRHAAEIGLRILRGEPPSTIPPLEADDYEDIFDWRQLKRWGIDEQRLPAGSAVQFRTPSLWDSYKRYVVAGVTLVLLQSALLVALLVSLAQRRRAHLAAVEADEWRRHAEEELQRQRDELAHALRLTTLGELTASVAHELRQPLTAILANAQAAVRMLPADPAHSGEVSEALADIAADARRAGETIVRLRALFRKEHAEHTPLDVNALIGDVLGLLRNDLLNQNIAVHIAPAQDLPPLLGDPVQLRQVILNVLMNARDAIAAGVTGPRAIHVQTGATDRTIVEIDIRDTGVGVQHPDLEHIFQHFVSSKPQGLGLGLAISRSIVEAHGGRIWATRNDDRGLTLHVELPVAPVQKREPPLAAGEHPIP